MNKPARVLRSAEAGECCNGHEVHPPCVRKHRPMTPEGEKLELGDVACLDHDVRYMSPLNVAQHVRNEGAHTLAFWCWPCNRYEVVQRGGES